MIEPRTSVHIPIKPDEEGWKRIRNATPDNTSSLWYVGKIDYIDVFGKAHWRTFRLRAEKGVPYETDKGTAVPYHFILCKEGNETDDTNKKKKAWLEWLKAPFL